MKLFRKSNFPQDSQIVTPSAFVEQIRRDFFSRKGMMYVKKGDLPKALQDVFPSTTDSTDEQERQYLKFRGSDLPTNTENNSGVRLICPIDGRW